MIASPYNALSTHGSHRSAAVILELVFGKIYGHPRSLTSAAASECGFQVPSNSASMTPSVTRGLD
jgi:hypothetical protein